VLEARVDVARRTGSRGSAQGRVKQPRKPRARPAEEEIALEIRVDETAAPGRPEVPLARLLLAIVERETAREGTGSSQA